MSIGRTNASCGGTGATLTVTAPADVTVTVSKDGKSKAKVAGTDGVAVFKGLSSGEWTVTITDGEQTSSKTVTITADYALLISFSTIPEFTYTGDYETVDDDDNPIMTSDGNWKIRFLTSGVFTPTELRGAGNGIDVFLVGAGGGSTSHAVGGCGGGYTRTGMAIHITPNTQYEITIGAGGTGGDGGSTSGFNLTAAGGKGIAIPHSGGLDGGSGGAALAGASDSSVGGSDGTNGTSGTKGGGKGQIALPGPNGETGSTREFSEPWGRLYASGGSAGGLDTTGPDGGGGGYKQSGKENTGGGGGGRIADSDPDTHGGSGIVIIRNHREVTE